MTNAIENMEGNYFLCGWKCVDQGFELWLLKNPRVKAVAATFTAADELLADKICARFGDGESKREYVPSPPLKTGRSRLFVSVWGDESVDALNGVELFSGKRCSVCRAILGKRTPVHIHIDGATPNQKNGFFVVSGHAMYVFSKDFVDLIEKTAAMRLQWRPVVSRGRKEIVELIGGEGVQEVFPRGRELSGWRCTTCGISRVLACSDSDGIRSHLAASSFKKQVPGIFTIADGRGVELGMTDYVWSQVRSKSQAKGLMSKPLGVIADEDVSLLSELPSYEKYQADPHRVKS